MTKTYFNKQSNVIYDQQQYQNDLELQQLPRYHHRLGQNVYYKDDNAYYSPGKTYSSIPQPRDLKFRTPITLTNMDDDISLMYSGRKNIEKYLAELEKELYKLLLFTDEPKFLKEDDKNLIVNDKYPFAYYDPTQLDKNIRAKKLKEKILKIKKDLGLNEEVGFYVTFKNNTFPIHSDDILNHYNESYSVQSKVDVPKVINGNFTQLEDVYNIRKVHLIQKNKPINSFDSFNNQNLGYHNQILDFIKNIKKNKNNSVTFRKISGHEHEHHKDIKNNKINQIEKEKVIDNTTETYGKKENKYKENEKDNEDEDEHDEDGHNEDEHQEINNHQIANQSDDREEFFKKTLASEFKSMKN